ncbi:MAG: hypothetical protein HQ525_11335 [Anaerolineae bacterium]|nr:hypothetical protein [Anaerolineae bacterium]
MTVQQTLIQLSTKDVALALKSASEDVQEKIFEHVSRRVERMIWAEMERMGSVSDAESEAAQQRIVEIVHRVEEAGEPPRVELL